MSNNKKAWIANCVGFLITGLLISLIFIFYDNSQGRSIYLSAGGYDIQSWMDERYEFIDSLEFELKPDEVKEVYTGTNESRGIVFSWTSLDSVISYTFYVIDEDGNEETSQGTLIDKNFLEYELRKGVQYKLKISGYGKDEGNYSGRLDFYTIK